MRRVLPIPAAPPKKGAAFSVQMFRILLASLLVICPRLAAMGKPSEFRRAAPDPPLGAENEPRTDGAVRGRR